MSTPKAETLPTTADLVSDRYEYLNIVNLGKGDVCQILSATARPLKGGDELPVIIKVARGEGFNDLVDNEAATLDEVRRNAAKIVGAEWFMPKLLDTFIYAGNRHVNVIEQFQGYYTLEEIRKEYPDGLPPQAVSWMGNRMFEALSILSLHNVVHGAILPPHVLFHFGDREDPLRHTMHLVDWTLAIRRDPATGLWSKRPARIERYADFYPPEKADEVTPATDLAMAAACLQYAMGGDAPRAMEFLIKSCRYPQPDSRPNILNFRQQFRSMLDRHYGAGRFYFTPMPRV